MPEDGGFRSSPEQASCPVIATITLLATAAQVEAADESAKVYAEIEQTFDFVPGFFRAYPDADAAIGGAWEEFKALQLNPDTDSSPKYKELIGLAVAVQEWAGAPQAAIRQAV